MNERIKREMKILEQAVNLAVDTQEFGGAKMYAILTLKNNIISYGFNSNKSHTIAKKFSRRDGCIYPHAEVMAIHNASKRLDLADLHKATLYVARVKRPFKGSKEFVRGLAKPCTGCQACIDAFGIKKVIYTTDGYGCDEWIRGDEW